MLLNHVHGVSTKAIVILFYKLCVFRSFSALQPKRENQTTQFWLYLIIIWPYVIIAQHGHMSTLFFLTPDCRWFLNLFFTMFILFYYFFNYFRTIILFNVGLTHKILHTLYRYLLSRIWNTQAFNAMSMMDFHLSDWHILPGSIEDKYILFA